MSSSDQCQCLISDRTRCTRPSSKKSTDDHHFCWQHQGCRTPITHTISSSKIVILPRDKQQVGGQRTQKAEKHASMPRTLLMQFIAKPNNKGNVHNMLLKLAKSARETEGSINCILHRLKNNPTAFYVLSNWTTQQKLDAHAQSIMRMKPLVSYLVAPPTITKAHMLSLPNTRPNKPIAVTNSPTQVTLIPFFTIKPDQVDAVRHAHLSMVDSTREEPGCIDYDLYQCEDPSVMFFYENWIDQMALAKHMNTSNFYRIVRGEVDGRLVVPWTALTMMLIGSPTSSDDYWPVLKPVGQHKAPGMRVARLGGGQNGQTDYVLVFKTGDEVMSGLLQFANKFKITDASLTAIGAVSHASFGWYDASKHAYKINRVNSQAELTSLIGNITTFNGKPTLHAHVDLALSDGSVRGGHALELFVFPTVELFVRVEPRSLVKKIDPTTGLPEIEQIMN